MASDDGAQSAARILPWAKPAAAATAALGGGLAFAWVSSSPPRQMWFGRETVTKTVTVAPWWADALLVVTLALLAVAILHMMVVGPRRV